MGTRHQGPTEETRALDAFIKLVRASESVIHRIHADLDAEALTVGQFGVLEALFHLGPLYQRDLCTKLLKSGGNITMVVGNLERRGLIRRERPPENRRLVRVTLTASGRRLIERLFPLHARAVVREFGVLSASEQAELGRLLKKLGRPAPRDRGSVVGEGGVGGVAEPS